MSNTKPATLWAAFFAALLIISSLFVLSLARIGNFTERLESTHHECMLSCARVPPHNQGNCYDTCRSDAFRNF